MHIDCSYGEGGGQVLRTALGLSSTLGIPVSLDNIRAGRSTPGLRPQHNTVVSTLSSICNASVSGQGIGSTSIAFCPSAVRPGSYDVDIGTAGSATLLAHALLLPLACAGGRSRLTVTGGTDVPWSPTYDYLAHVTLPFLRLLGVRCSASCKRHGYYPRGGGVLTLDIEPWVARRGVGRMRTAKPGTLYVSSCSSGLPERVAMAQADAVATMLPGYETSVSYEYRGAGIGSSVTVWAKAGDIPIGASAIGRKGVPAAEVGAMAATEFLEVLESGGADPHLPDQSVAFMAMAGSGSIVPLSKKTSHLETVSWVTRQFMPCSISLSDTELAVRPRKEV